MAKDICGMFHTPDAKQKNSEFDTSFLNSSNRNLSTICLSKTPSEIQNSFDPVSDSPLDGNPYDNEIRIFQTPISDEYKLKNDWYKSASIKLFNCNEIVSSTPILKMKDYYKTPENKRKLFHSCSSNNRNTSIMSSSDSKYFPVSSPTSSQKLMFDNSRFLNESLSTFCQHSCSKNSFLNEIEDKSEKSLYIKNCKSIVDSTLVDRNDSICNKPTSLLNDNFSASVKLKSIDLLPGIKPLNYD